MKKLFLLCFLMIVSISLMGQVALQEWRISYFSPFGYHPGVKIGAGYALSTWETEGKKVSKKRMLMLTPSIGYLTFIRDYTALNLGVEFGLRSQKQGKKGYFQPTIGAGYLAQFDVVSQAFNLQGESVSKQRERIDFLLPTIGVEWGEILVKSGACSQNYLLRAKSQVAGKILLCSWWKLESAKE